MKITPTQYILKTIDLTNRSDGVVVLGIVFCVHRLQYRVRLSSPETLPLSFIYNSFQKLPGPIFQNRNFARQGLINNCKTKL